MTLTDLFDSQVSPQQQAAIFHAIADAYPLAKEHCEKQLPLLPLKAAIGQQRQMMISQRLLALNDPALAADPALNQARSAYFVLIHSDQVRLTVSKTAGKSAPPAYAQFRAAEHERQISFAFMPDLPEVPAFDGPLCAIIVHGHPKGAYEAPSFVLVRFLKPSGGYYLEALDLLARFGGKVVVPQETVPPVTTPQLRPTTERERQA